MAEETNNTPISEGPPTDQESEAFSILPVEEQVTALQEHLQKARQEANQNLDAAQRAQAGAGQLSEAHRRRTDIAG